MVSLKDAVKAFLKSRALYSEWCEHHEMVVTRITTIANVMARLPALSIPASYSLFAGEDTALCTEVHAAQLKDLEETWQATLESMGSVHHCVPQLQRRHAELMARVTNSKVSRAALERKMGPDPSVAELLDTMQCMFTMIARQTHIEQSIMDRLNYDTGEEEMGQILRFFHDTPEVDRERIEMMIAQVEATQMFK